MRRPPIRRPQGEIGAHRPPRVVVTRPTVIVRDRVVFASPNVFGGVTYRPIHHGPLRSYVALTFGNPAWNALRLQWQTTTILNQIAWHNHGGHNYAHRWDGNRHWWGFYFAVAGVSTFYWTQIIDDRYWWYEPRWGRWCYWDDGYWRYPIDNGPVLVYEDGNYFEPQQGTGGVVLRPTPPQEPPVDTNIPAPAPVDEKAQTYYDDGMKVAVIVKEAAEGIKVLLYDHKKQDQDGNDEFIGQLIQLNKGVTVDGVEFSEDSTEQPLQITVRTIGNDGKKRSTTFDGQTGERLGRRNAELELRPEDIGVQHAELKADGDGSLVPTVLDGLTVDRINAALQR
ncbi:MAG: hypothetical protein HY078_13060 [Elusimicrobia bacterium]|nr:hypothetical protein [Elusimicrobiota bacterium]